MKTIRIKDYYGIYQEVPVSDEVYEEYRNSHRDVDRQHKKDMYHGCFVPLDSVEETVSIGGIDAMIDDIILKEEIIRLYQALEKLKPHERRRIMMFMNNLSYSEIARRENIDVGSIHRTCAKALKKLRKFMTE